MWHSWTESFMAILSRHPLTPTGVLSGNGYEGLLARIGSDPPITVLLLDVSPQITSSRRKVFSEIRLNLSKLTPPPDLIAGDFNTPQLSFSLTQMREMGYTDSYSDAGSGISYTWPSFLPLTRIDFVLVKKGRNVSEHQIGFSSLSDHAWQRVDIYRPGFSNDR
jgi:endonuclease/exonuclease/phosphatase family metal-dependent hydrolase